MKGVLDRSYARQREKRPDIRYRLKRRTQEILRAIAEYRPDPETVLDLGTAEGRMLSSVKFKISLGLLPRHRVFFGPFGDGRFAASKS